MTDLFITKTGISLVNLQKMFGYLDSKIKFPDLLNI